MKVLIACEYSGRVRDAFIKAGHEAMSCDILPTDMPGPHYQGDVFNVIDWGWDLMIAHPPCTYLCSSGLHWNKRRPERAKLTELALDFVSRLWKAPIPKICVENPQGCINTRLQFMPKPQYVHPYQFGEDASKRTGLWLKGLPFLTTTNYIDPRYVCCGLVVEDRYGCPNCCGDKKPKSRWANQTDSGQNRLGPSVDRWKLRSTTYQGIANAMAKQWGGPNA